MTSKHCVLISTLTLGSLLLWSMDAMAAPPQRPDIEAGLILGTTLDLEQWDLQTTPDGSDSPSLFSPQLGLRGTWWVIDYIGLTAEVAYLPHTSELSDGFNHAMSWRAGGMIAPFPGWKYEPFLSGGWGVYHNIAGSRGTDVDQRSDYGIGLRFVPGQAERTLLQFDVRHVITDGHEEFGLNNNLEVLAAAQWTFGGEPEEVPPADRDGDGIIDDRDACPDTPGIAAFEGCPDTDSDGIPDAQDKCPDTPGIEQFEGCPDTDNDGIPDAKDQCIEEPEDKDGFEDEDGCPDPDNDNDKILDAQDKCPDEAETYNGIEDEDGCPETDRDGDGLLDPVDQCPDEAETYNGNKDDDGCPDGDQTVIITKTEIKILEQIFFDTGKATIKPRSFPLLDTVATVLVQNPQITRIRVEGHTDDVGKEEMNLQLSRDRAASVMKYLGEHGVAPERLESEGYGESKPLCEKMDELLKNKRKNKKAIADCRATNRRVQFQVSEIDGKPIDASSSIIIEEKKVVEEPVKP